MLYLTYNAVKTCVSYSNFFTVQASWKQKPRASSATYGLRILQKTAFLYIPMLRIIGTEKKLITVSRVIYPDLHSESLLSTQTGGS